MTRIRFINCDIDCMTFAESLQVLEEALITGRRGYVVTPNAAHIVTLEHNPTFRRAYRDAALVLPDGFSIIAASRILGTPFPERVCGSDLMIPLCGIAERLGKRVFILGGVGGSQMRAVQNLRARFPRLAVDCFAPPFGFEKDAAGVAELVRRINGFATDVLFVCVGAPKSEILMHRIMPALCCTLALAVGSAVEYTAGTIARAPHWVRTAGMEWAWRLILEPRRLWRRYLIGNAIFMLLVARTLYRRLMNTGHP